MSKSTTRIAILGSGMAALGASHRLHSEGFSPVLYEKNAYHGGHTASHKAEGFIFDEGPHVSFTNNARIRELFAKSVDQKYQTVDAKVNNYWKGHWIKHPVICNLHGLPSDLVVKVISDFVKSQNLNAGPFNNYEEWLIATYGRTYAEVFPMQYTRKYHTTEPSNLSTDWLGQRLYRADLDEVLLGAVSPSTPNVHYVPEYRYPTNNGFVSYLDLFSRQSQIMLNHRLTAIDPRARRLTFSNGVTAAYDRLISSIPLPDLLPMIAGGPRDVQEAAGKLACTTVVLVNLGIDRPDVSDASWSYFYEDEYVFSRVCFPHRMSSRVVPQGKSSIQAEIYFSNKYKPLRKPSTDYIEPVIDGLIRCGLIQEQDKILFKGAMVIPYGNIIFDLERAEALKTVHGYLDDLGIRYCGRYGDWGYLWTDESFISGENAAQRVLDHMTSSCLGSA